MTCTGRGDDVYRSGMMTCTRQRNNTPLRKTVGFPKTCDNENNKRVWQVAGFTDSIASLQNWLNSRRYSKKMIKNNLWEVLVVVDSLCSN